MAAAMWRLHRYYLRELLVNASITFAVLFAIVVISLVARGVQRAEGGGLLDAAIITMLWALDSFPHLLPISFLLATVTTFARAGQEREITAIRAAGVSPRVPMMASVLVGLALSVVGSLTLHYLLPEVHFRKYRVIVEAVRNTIVNMGLGSSDDRVSIPGTDVALTYARREGEGEGADIVFRDCWLYLPDDRARDLGFVSPVVHVDRVRIPWPKKDDMVIRVVLENGSDPLTNTRFDLLEPRFPLPAISDSKRRDERDDDMGSSQLLSEVLRGQHERPMAARYTLNRRTCFAILPLLLGPIGFCLALASQNRGRAVSMLLALLPIGVFYVGDVMGCKLLRATGEPMFGWLPAALLIVLGTPFCWRELRR
jgi:lipopolysaccharide export LptBFGC system permease protein LptF